MVDNVIKRDPTVDTVVLDDDTRNTALMLADYKDPRGVVTSEKALDFIYNQLALMPPQHMQRFANACNAGPTRSLALAQHKQYIAEIAQIAANMQLVTEVTVPNVPQMCARVRSKLQL